MTCLSAHTTVVDARGLRCPMPVVELARAMESEAPGAVVELISDDADARVDVAVWVRMKRHEMVRVQEVGEELRFLVRRGE